MTTSTAQLAMIREYVSGLLDELGLDAYLFEIEPRDGVWELKVECAIAQGWYNVTIMLEAHELQASGDNEQIKQSLLNELNKKLRDCKRQNG